MKRTAGIIILAIVFFPANGCERSGKKRPRPNLIIFMVDALRADGLGCYGNNRDPSPFLDSYAKKGALFRNAFTHSSHTKISIASLFTGLIPPRHGLRRAGSWTEVLTSAAEETLSRDLLTMAEFFRLNGYYTFGVSTNPHVTEIFGFGQGFDEFAYIGRERPWIADAAKVHETATDRFLSPGYQPFFLYLHYMDVHAPYLPPEPYKSNFTRGMAEQKELWTDGPHKGEVSPERIEYSRATYTAQIRCWDDEFKKFMGELDGEGLLDNTIVIIMSDHGEEFHEHGGFGHGFTCYDEMLSVPLIMAWPGIIPEGLERFDSAQIIDIFPTLSRLIGLDVKDLPLQGRDLFADGWEGKPGLLSRIRKRPPRLLYAETYRGKIPRCLRAPNEKIIYNDSAESYEFYRLDLDPAEKENSYDLGVPEIRELKQKLDSMRLIPLERIKYPAFAWDDKSVPGKTDRRKSSEDNDGEIKRALKSLGYLDH
jgi:arylsulfatase A-like enzyme